MRNSTTTATNTRADPKCKKNAPPPNSATFKIDTFNTRKQEGGFITAQAKEIKCYHRLVDKITDIDTRLANHQKYTAQALWGNWII